jgi:hypothetical protein
MEVTYQNLVNKMLIKRNFFLFFNQKGAEFCGKICRTQKEMFFNLSYYWTADRNL